MHLTCPLTFGSELNRRLRSYNTIRILHRNYRSILGGTYEGNQSYRLYGAQNGVHLRHLGRTNLLFADGHAGDSDFNGMANGLFQKADPSSYARNPQWYRLENHKISY